LAGAKQKAQELHEKALDSLSLFGKEADLCETYRFTLFSGLTDNQLDYCGFNPDN